MNVAGKVLAVSGDGFARMYGQGERGAGHAVFIPAGCQGDPLGGSGARIVRACGSSLPTEKATEKFQGDKRCPKCVEWLATADGSAALESARAERHAWEFGADDMAELFSVAEVNGTDTREDSAPAVRELTPADVKGAVRKSTRGAAVARERKRLADQAAAREVKGADKREDSAPVDPPADGSGPEIIASTGKTLAQMREETATFYANGGAVSPEIAALPAPGTVSLASGTVSGSAAEILVCTFKGEVSTVNPERTHGKCPECTTYIPLLPGGAGGKESGPKVSKIKCEGTGSAPAPGTRVMRDDHTVSVADDYSGKHSGKCPECARVIAVSREGGMRKHNGLEVREATGADVDKIGKHNVGGVATPAGKGLSSKSIETVEHGSVPGDPASADKRRAAEIEERGADAREFKGGADTGATVRKGARLALSRGHGSVDGSATTGSQNMAPVQPKGWVGVAGTGSLPAMVRPGIDPEVTGRECVICEELPEIAHAGKSRGWRRRHSAKVGAVLRDRKAKRDAVREAKIESGEILPASVKREARKAASVGSFSEGTVNGSVTHALRPEFEPKGTRKPAPNGNKHTRRSGRAE
ncbi:hypothetical protein SEA_FRANKENWEENIE_365 [Streptomyces phage Frankenweenie]|nr:hypothetical protein SEA_FRANKENWEENIE_365 [Streptomyces phage Frankenweenie]